MAALRPGTEMDSYGSVGGDLVWATSLCVLIVFIVSDVTETLSRDDVKEKFGCW